MRASDVAYERLRDDIIHWRLEPGTPLGEVEVSSRIGVSRTPVREALTRLAAEGLVSNRGRTAKVATVSAEEVEKLYELREALETQAARLAARRRDTVPFEALRRDLLARPDDAIPAGDESSAAYDLADRLDVAIDEAMGNDLLSGALGDIRGNLARLRRYAQFDPARLAQATAEHLTIVDAILRRDEMLAAQATAVHLRRSLDHILAAIDFAGESTSAPTSSEASP